jgi:hypothetical protein
VETKVTKLKPMSNGVGGTFFYLLVFFVQEVFMILKNVLESINTLLHCQRFFIFLQIYLMSIFVFVYKDRRGEKP